MSDCTAFSTVSSLLQMMLSAPLPAPDPPQFQLQAALHGACRNTVQTQDGGIRPQIAPSSRTDAQASLTGTSISGTHDLFRPNCG